MRIPRNIILTIICLLVCALSVDVNAQSARKDSVRQFMVSFSPLSFAGKYPSLQGGLYYRLDSKSAIDFEFSYLYRKFSNDINQSLGFIAKAGYMKRISESKNFLVSRLYFRNSQFLGREEFERFGGEYIERIDFHSTNNSLGLTVGALRHISGDVCDFQFGLSVGAAKLFYSGELPQDAELILTGWNQFNTRNDIANPSNFESLFYADFKFFF